jgi:hypothetical protein
MPLGTPYQFITPLELTSLVVLSLLALTSDLIFSPISIQTFQREYYNNCYIFSIIQYHVFRTRNFIKKVVAKGLGGLYNTGLLIE